MGRRRRRVVRIVKKKLPTVFVCPRCGEEAVRVTIAKDTGHATVLCALCNLRDEFPAHPAAQPIDVYSYFTDRFYGVKDPRPIIPRDRPILTPPQDEEVAETVVSAAEIVAEPAAGQTIHETPEIKPETSRTEQPLESPVEQHPMETSSASEPDTSEQVREETSAESETESREESEPFADILENKDKKRYSSTPLPQQSSEPTS